MSLNGNLEDLPLLDILQIVSFSKKTGYLAIRTTDGLGAIVFQDGSVVSSFTWDTLPLDPRAASLAPDKREKLLRTRIETAIEQLIRLREGGFSFALTEEPPRTVEGRDISAETLSSGINAQELLLDLARGMDEDRRDSTAALEASFAEPDMAAEGVASEAPAAESAEPEAGEEQAPPAPGEAPEASPAAPPDMDAGMAALLGEEAPAAVPEPTTTLPPPVPAGPSVAERAPVPAGRPSVLLVDDEEEVRRILGEHFQKAGYDVIDAEDPDTALKKAAGLGKEGRPFLLVTDLGMPTSGGTSFQGGFEVVKRLAKMNLRPPVLMMTDTLSAAIQTRAKQMGVRSFVFKPGLSKLDPEQFDADLRAFAAKLVTDVLPRMERTLQPALPPRPSAGAAEGPAAAPSPTDALSRDFALLQRWLAELRKPQDPTQISQLVVRVAREFFERGILFVVKNEEIRGLTGFGPARDNESLHLLARGFVVPLSEPSPFEQVVGSQKVLAGPLPENRWTAELYERIGRFKAKEGALLPLLTHRETIALLYGDNAVSGRPLKRLDGLEVFLNQAGIALENAFLQRKVHALQGQE
ncbi:MAG TPA: DUF4388 domain-containing protein [Vicinamibacteria bacterium]|nr:DUF4388 domain-containing protein [Vicinamibacteria bacterium]